VAALRGPAAAELVTLRANLMARIQRTRQSLARVDPLDAAASVPLVDLLERYLRMLGMLGAGAAGR
jgi:hypothetical protein